jgi:hypothetical protein
VLDSSFGRNLKLTVPRTACGETNINARSLSAADANAILSKVCASAAAKAGVAPRVCGISSVTTGSIVITITIEFSISFSFPEWVDDVIDIIESIFGLPATPDIPSPAPSPGQ